MFDSGAQYIETLKIKQRKLSRNSNGHNFSHVCPARWHNISRSSKCNNGSSREIQMVITFHSEVQFRRITYRDAWNWNMEALEKLSGHNVSHGRPIRAHNKSWRSKLNNGSSREIEMVITFNSDVRFRRITYLDTRNCTTEALEKFKWS